MLAYVPVTSVGLNHNHIIREAMLGGAISTGRDAMMLSVPDGGARYLVIAPAELICTVTL